MRSRARCLLLVVAAMIVTLSALPPLQAQGGRPKTIHDLILELGAKPKQAQQVRLRLAGTIVAKDLAGLPEAVEINVLYDEPSNRIRIVEASTYETGAKKKVTTLATKERALIWTERTPPAGEAAPPLEVRSVDAALALPNPWRLPAKLGYTGMFADALHGYEAFGREYARSARLNREPDERGLVWFDLKPSPGAGKAMRYSFNEGLRLKAGFAAEAGWLQELEVHYAESDAVMTLRVTDRVTELSEDELAGFEFPEEVVEAWENRSRSTTEPKPKPAFGPRRELEKKPLKRAGAGGR